MSQPGEPKPVAQTETASDRHGAGAMAPGACVVCSAVLLWLLSGVGPGVIARFVAYELVFVLGPGWLLFTALTKGGNSHLRQLVFGWTLGYVLEILAFIATAAIGLRSLFLAYPILILLLSLAIGRGGRGGWRATAKGHEAPHRNRGASPWPLAAVCFAALVYIGLVYFALQAPLPQTGGDFSYPNDVMFHLSLAAEAKHHWPVMAPNLAGMDLDYHVFAVIDMAAVSQVTGIGLPLVILRLAIVPLIVLLVCGLSLAGSALARHSSSWVGPAAAALYIFVGEVDLTPYPDQPFFGLIPPALWQSPSFLMGAVLFVPALLLICERLSGTTGRNWRRENWLVLALLLVGCAGAKAPAPPVLIGGLVLFIGWRWLRERQVGSETIRLLALTATVWLVFWLFAYSGESFGFSLDPPGGIRFMEVTYLGEHLFSGFLNAVFWVVATPIGLLGLLGAPLLGLWWVFKSRLLPTQVFLLAVLVASLTPFLILAQGGVGSNGGIYFPMYGLLAGVLVSAEGLTSFFSRYRNRGEGSLAWLLLFVIIWSALLVAISYAGKEVYETPGRPLHRPYLVWYGVPAFGLLILFAVPRLLSPEKWRHLAVLPVVAILTLGAMDIPLDWGPNSIERARNDEPLYRRDAVTLNADFLAGLTWVRNNTDEDAVLAVSNQARPEARAAAPGIINTAAFAERRVFLEGWVYSARANIIGTPDVAARRKELFLDRLRLEERAFRADAQALSLLYDGYGVRYLLVDKRNGSASRRLRRILPIVFSNRILDIYRLTDLPRAIAKTRAGENAPASQ
jgi:hypothetical protein